MSMAKKSTPTRRCLLQTEILRYRITPLSANGSCSGQMYPEIGQGSHNDKRIEKHKHEEITGYQYY